MAGVACESRGEDERRAYWVEQMDAAYEFMGEVSAYPVSECGEPLEPLRCAVEEAGVEVAFSARPHVRGIGRVFCLRRGLVAGFVAAAREMNAHGWALRVEDGYRSREMQRYLSRVDYVLDVILGKVVWELDGELPTTAQLCKRVTALVATTPKMGTHMSGSALDVSVIARDDGSEVWRGGPYLELSELTPMASPFVSAEARGNRRAISKIMRGHGFVAYPYEFWHYSQGDAYDEYLNRSGRPARYGAVDADLETGEVTPIENPLEALNSVEEIQAEVEGALRRLRGEGVRQGGG